MKTKLVYVLTCAPEARYLEQALVAVYSARHWNPDATIVLVVDDKTDALLVGKRGEILNYISEKKVVPFEDESLTPMYRSRWIKTQVRQMIDGDLLFIDSDTICCKSLAEVDEFSNLIGAVYDSHVTLAEDRTFEPTRELVLPLGLDLNKEAYYYSSGVIYVKDNQKTKQFYKSWHELWKEGNDKYGIAFDQPSFAKVNVDMNHIVTSIPDKYNCILYTQNSFLKDAAILHISGYVHASFLFSREYLLFIRENGLTENAKQWIRKAKETWMPYDYHVLHSIFKERLHMISQLRRTFQYVHQELHQIPEDWFRMNSRLRKTLLKMLNHKFYMTGACAWMVWERIHVLKNKRLIKDNICKI